MTKKINYGFIEPEITVSDFIFGSTDKTKTLKGKILVPDGQWDKWLPENEMQNRQGFESYNCSNYGTLNAKDTLEKRLYGTVIDNSERFLGVVSKTSHAGNNPHGVAEAIRKHGLIPETELTWTPDINTWEEYYSPKPMTKKYLDMGKEWLKEYDFKHEYAFHGYDSLASKQEKLQEALRQSPIGISVYAWINRNGVYYKPSGARDNHWCTCYGYVKDKYWKIFDSYDNTRKKVEWNTNFSFAKKYQLEKIIKESKKKIMIKLIRELGSGLNRPVYAIVGGKKFWVTSWDVLDDFIETFGYSNLREAQNSIKEVEKSTLNGYPYGGSVGNLSMIDFMRIMFGNEITK